MLAEDKRVKKEPKKGKTSTPVLQSGRNSNIFELLTWRRQRGWVLWYKGGGRHPVPGVGGFATAGRVGLPTAWSGIIDGLLPGRQ